MFRKDIKLFSGTSDRIISGKESDYFGTLDKADSLLEVLQMREVIEEIKMIALFGEWGSGKSTFIKYVNNELAKKGYKSFVFETWQLEYGNDLHLSLLDCIVQELKRGNKKRMSEGIKKAINLCYLFTKNLALNSSVELFGINLALGSAGRETVQEFNEEYTLKSSYGKLKEFKESYEKVIDHFLDKSQELIIFIDDLDRCEPENVIALLSAIKHFFTYDKRVKFVCALDKDAVTKALKVKYADVVKSTEYLEKLFDLTMTLNRTSDLTEIINYYSDSTERADLSKFLREFGLTNPRHLLKILNRVYILKRIIEHEKHKIIFSYIDIQESSELDSYYKNRLFYHLLFFFVTFKEFYPDEFNVLSNYDYKRKKLIGNIKDRKNNPLEELNVFQEMVNAYSKTDIINSSSLPPKENASEDNTLVRFFTFLYNENAVILDDIAFAGNVNIMIKSIDYLKGLQGDWQYNFLRYLFTNEMSILFCNPEGKFVNSNEGVNFNISLLYDFVKNH